MYFRSINLIPKKINKKKKKSRLSWLRAFSDKKERADVFNIWCPITVLLSHLIVTTFLLCENQIRESRMREWFVRSCAGQKVSLKLGFKGELQYTRFFWGVSCSSRERRDHLTHEKFMLIELWHKQAPQKEHCTGKGALHHRLQQQLVWFSWKTNSPGLADACPRASS